jgi:hypothetical protein
MINADCDGKRIYDLAEGEALKGKTVICDMVGCDGKERHGKENKPHIYDDVECFAECNWPGKNGLCVPIETLKK